MAFARDDGTLAYYERRAAEYDDWWTGEGAFASRDRPGWGAEVDALVEVLRSLPPARTLDVACGTGFLTRHLPGVVAGLDQSASMVAIAQGRVPDAVVLRGSALELPFADGAFERVHAGHFHGHLPPPEREAWLREARRVAGEVVVTDTARRDDVPAERWEERVLDDGSRHAIFKRFLTPAELTDELGGGEVLFDGQWFVCVRA